MSEFLLFGVPVIAFILGVSKRPWWTIAVCPALEVAIWGLGRLTVDPSYDQKGLYLLAGGFLAIGSAVAWLIGRVLSEAIRAR